MWYYLSTVSWLTVAFKKSLKKKVIFISTDNHPHPQYLWGTGRYYPTMYHFFEGAGTTSSNIIHQRLPTCQPLCRERQMWKHYPPLKIGKPFAVKNISVILLTILSFTTWTPNPAGINAAAMPINIPPVNADPDAASSDGFRLGQGLENTSILKPATPDSFAKVLLMTFNITGRQCAAVLLYIIVRLLLITYNLKSYPAKYFEGGTTLHESLQQVIYILNTIWDTHSDHYTARSKRASTNEILRNYYLVKSKNEYSLNIL